MMSWRTQTPKSPHDRSTLNKFPSNELFWCIPAFKATPACRHLSPVTQTPPAANYSLWLINWDDAS